MNRFFMFLLVLTLVFSPALFAESSSGPVIKGDTLAAVYLNAGKIFNAYKTYLNELMKPENKAKLDEAIGQMQQHLPQKLDFMPIMKELDDFAKSEILVPTGPMWFSIDSSFIPNLSLPAKTSPLKLLELMDKAGKSKRAQPRVAKEDLVRFDFPAAKFSLVLEFRPTGIFLFAEDAEKPGKEKPHARWNSLSERAADENTRLAGVIDIGAISRLVAAEAGNSKVSACMTNMRILSGAVEMYNMDYEKGLAKLNQAELKKTGYLKAEIVCPDGGKYSLEKGNRNGIVCSVHGTVASPVFPKNDDSVPAPLKHFEKLNFHVTATGAEFALEMNDKNTQEQFLAIGRQQLQSIRHMAENQLGRMPEEQKRKGLEMLNSISISSEDNWLKISVSGLDEATMMSVVAGLGGAAAGIAIPNFRKAREKAQMSACLANRKVILVGCEMFLMDNEKFPADFGFKNLVEGKYLKKVPECPEGGQYKIDINGNEIEVECSVHGK